MARREHSHGTTCRGGGSNRHSPAAHDHALTISTYTDAGPRLPLDQSPKPVEGCGDLDPDTGLPIRAEGAVPEVAVDPNNGNLYVAWQDTRFSGVDEIAFSMSTDGGVSWSTPIRVNQTPRSADVANEQAWVPAVHVAAEGTVAVLLRLPQQHPRCWHADRLLAGPLPPIRHNDLWRCR